MHAILITTAALVGLPVLLHLILKQEPKRYLFPAIRFLQQKRRTSQRKMRLKHLLLLLLRMGLIAFFGLALFQPMLFNSGLHLSGEQPIAAIFILDSSPSMGYITNDRTRVAEAQRRALELLDELPSSSRVALIDPLEPLAKWEQSLADARRKLEDWKEPRGATVPITTALAQAYQLLRTVDQETDSPEPLPRLIAIFSDRTAGSWDATRNEDLEKLRDTIPKPDVVHLYLDVGVDQPANVGIVSSAIEPQLVPVEQEMVLNATVAVSGPEVNAAVKVRFPGTNIPEQIKEARIPADGTQGVSFKIDSRMLPPGLYQAEVTLDTPDKLMADNTRYLTVKVIEPRKILTLCDNIGDAFFWQLAHDAKGEFKCDVAPSNKLPDLKPYEAVCLLNVKDPTPLWPALLKYVESGGKLVLMPGDDVLLSAYTVKTSETTALLLPGSLTSVVDTQFLKPVTGRTADQMAAGVPWLLDEATLRHPMLKPFRAWKLQSDIDVIKVPRRAWKFWEMETGADGSAVVHYDDSDLPKTRHAAILERTIGKAGGRVLMLSTRMDPQVDRTQRWNNYWETEQSTWYVVFPSLLMRYQLGDPSEANFSFLTGQTVPITLPRGEAKAGWTLELQGPGVSLADASLTVGENQTELQLPPNRTLTAGNFLIRTPDKKWGDGYSLNILPEERSLTRLPVEMVQPLLGPDAIVPIEKKLSLRESIASKFNQPIDLFPWLLILVLFLVALEGWFANRFYRK